MIPKNDNRAVSTVLGYALSLSIATLLISGLFIATGDLVQNERERAVRSELEVIGQQVAADVTAADRLVNTTGANATVVEHDFPSDVAGSTYLIELRPNGGSPVLVLSTTTPEVSVNVSLATDTEIRQSTVSGGSVRVAYVGDSNGNGRNELRVENG